MSSNLNKFNINILIWRETLTESQLGKGWDSEWTNIVKGKHDDLISYI